MAANQVTPPLPKGFVLESEIPPLPKGFVIEDDSDIKVDTVKTEVKKPKEEKVDKVQPGLRVAPEPTFGQKFKSLIRGMFVDDLNTNVESQMIYQISKDTGKSLQEVSKDYDKLIRDPEITGIRPDPTVMEGADIAFTGAIAAGLSTNPITDTKINSKPTLSMYQSETDCKSMLDPTIRMSKRPKVKPIKDFGGDLNQITKKSSGNFFKARNPQGNGLNIYNKSFTNPLEYL